MDADLLIGERYVGEIRQMLSKEISNWIKNQLIDYIVPIPNTGSIYAKILSEISGVEYLELIKKRGTKKTTGLPHASRKKLNNETMYLTSSSLKNKTLLFVDETIVSGQTVKLVIDMCTVLKDCKFKFAFAGPPVIKDCVYDLHFREKLLLNESDTLAQNISSAKEFVGSNDIYFGSKTKIENYSGCDKLCMKCFANDN